MEAEKERNGLKQACCYNGCCLFFFPNKHCGKAVCCWIAVVVVLTIVASFKVWYYAFGALLGQGLEKELRDVIPKSIETDDWGPVEEIYNDYPFLGQSVLIVGGKNGRLTVSRGNGKIAEKDQKMPIASASKWVSATVVYCVIEDPNSNLTTESRPGDYFPFWSCSNPADKRCTDITVEKLLAFRHGLSAEVERDFTDGDWEAYVEKVFNEPYDQSRFDTFEYGSVGLYVGGLMALKEKQKQANYTNANWDDLLEECVSIPATITDAPKRYDAFSNGKFTYDYDFQTKSSNGYNPGFPGLGGSMGASPNQYANFLEAFMNKELVTANSVYEMTRPHGDTGKTFGFDPEELEERFGITAFQEYAQGMWHAGENVTHSLGYFGFFPWLDQSASNSTDHFYGVLAIQAEEQLALIMSIAGPVILLPITALAALFTFLCLSHRNERKRTEESETIVKNDDI